MERKNKKKEGKKEGTKEKEKTGTKYISQQNVDLSSSTIVPEKPSEPFSSNFACLHHAFHCPLLTSFFSSFLSALAVFFFFILLFFFLVVVLFKLLMLERTMRISFHEAHESRDELPARTPLLLAVEGGHREAVAALIEFGANVNAPIGWLQLVCLPALN